MCFIRGLFNFHWKTKVYAVRVNIVIIGQLYLKVKLFHVLVGAMGNFFFRVYIFKHSLEYHIECFRNISDNVIVILVLLFFFYFIFCIVIVRSCSVYGRGQSYVVKDRNSQAKANFICYFSLHLDLDNQIFLFLFCYFVVVCCCCCFSFSCSTISSSRAISSVLASGSLSLVSPYTTFLYFLV